MTLSFDDIPYSIVREINGTENHLDDENILQWFAKNCDDAETASKHLNCQEIRLVQILQEKEIKILWDIDDEIDHTDRYKGVTTEVNKNVTVVEDPTPTIDEERIEKHRGKQGMYVLSCENDNFYVGISTDLGNRLRQHFTGRGSLWTKRHDPERIVSVEYMDCRYDKLLEKENDKTLEMMETHGWRNVRGGKWWSPFVSSKPKSIS